MSMKNILKGIQIFLKYKPNGWLGAAHDIIFGPGCEVLPEDKEELIAVGWFWDDELERWSHFT